MSCSMIMYQRRKKFAIIFETIHSQKYKIADTVFKFLNTTIEF